MIDKPVDPESIFFDVVVIGGGAAGLMCALTAGQRGKRVLVLEVSNMTGKKILMSGGGRCNFTNLDVQSEHFICKNPHFVKSALSQYSQWDFIGMVSKHGVAYHEKLHGQLFCDNSAKDILKLLSSECDQGGVEVRLNCRTESVKFCAQNEEFQLQSNQGNFCSRSLVIATGGLSIPTLGGATGYGYQLAQQFNLAVSQTEASLVPMTLTGKWHELANALSGVGIPVIASASNKRFKESLLFTHRGLSGPAILQLSNYWYLGESIFIDLLPDRSVEELLLGCKSLKSRKPITSILTAYLPKSLVYALASMWWPDFLEAPIVEIKDSQIRQVANQLHHWQLTPSGTEGYRTAEVTRGGVDVNQISSKTMQVENEPGLFMIGEVLDVTGHLGGYNFQWAWSSGYVAGMNVL